MGSEKSRRELTRSEPMSRIRLRPIDVCEPLDDEPTSERPDRGFPTADSRVLGPMMIPVVSL